MPEIARYFIFGLLPDALGALGVSDLRSFLTLVAARRDVNA
jgi:hypothetical protein